MATKKIKDSIYVSALKKDNAELTKLNQELMKKYAVKTSDPVVNDVINRIFIRHQQGMEKFKKTMAQNSKTISEWIEDVIEELLDATCYLSTLKNRIHKEKEDLYKEIDRLRDDNQIAWLSNHQQIDEIPSLW